MLTIRQSPFDLFERLEQQIATAERVPNAEILDNETAYIVRLELPGVTRDSIDVKATDRNLVITAERPADSQDNDSAPLLSEFRSGTWSAVSASPTASIATPSKPPTATAFSKSPPKKLWSTPA